MSKESRDEEIEHLCDIAVAQANSRLMEGAEFLLNFPSDATIADDEAYHAFRGTYQREEPYTLSEQRGATTRFPPQDAPIYVRDDYREQIEAEPTAELQLDPGPLQRMPDDACGSCGTARSGRLPEHFRLQVNNIKDAISTYPNELRSDVGYLLEIVDAFDQGRM
jgi:hypothetical protein